MTKTALSLFAAFGVELEYMLVDSRSMSVLPIADQLLAAAAGTPVADYEDGPITWSNELVNHVIELKTTGPTPSLVGLESTFAAGIHRVNERLAPLGGRLLPAAMHPWMDPLTETRLWPLDNSEVYQAFDRIFSCQGHGWSNLQSVHLNLPFANDEEFARLHAAIRLVLPILPALAASSPIVEGRLQKTLDSRLNVYRTNCARIPSMTGRVIPEPVFSASDYNEQIFQKLYRDIAPFDPEGILQEEWLNARGAIPRFSRNTIEIRVLDIQECPQADLAVLRLIVAVLKDLVAQRHSSLANQQAWPVEPLEKIFLQTMEQAEYTTITDSKYLRGFGITDQTSLTAGKLWQHLYQSALESGQLKKEPALEVILQEGTLASRLVRSLGKTLTPDRQQLQSVCERLCDCLARGEMFRG